MWLCVVEGLMNMVRAVGMLEPGVLRNYRPSVVTSDAHTHQTKA